MPSSTAPNGMHARMTSQVASHSVAGMLCCTILICNGVSMTAEKSKSKCASIMHNSIENCFIGNNNYFNQKTDENYANKYLISECIYLFMLTHLKCDRLAAIAQLQFSTENT